MKGDPVGDTLNQNMPSLLQSTACSTLLVVEEHSMLLQLSEEKLQFYKQLV